MAYYLTIKADVHHSEEKRNEEGGVSDMWRKNLLPFQGDKNKSPYFEGWYYKQVSSNQQTALSLIVGMSVTKEDSHSFIQYIFVSKNNEGKSITKTGYSRFSLDDFVYQKDPFVVKIADNLFSESLISVHLEDDDINIAGNLRLGKFQDIKRTTYSPTIMGPFTYIPHMECQHEVVSMSHFLEGSLEINNRSIDFTGGKGYIEKDWGRSFPKDYIWIQSNHFNDNQRSLFFSYAHIPFYGKAFQGFICSFYDKGKEYRFATYNASKIAVTYPSDVAVAIELESTEGILKLKAIIKTEGELIAPLESGMQKAIKEGIEGEVYLSFFNKKTKQTIEDKGIMAGIELVDES